MQLPLFSSRDSETVRWTPDRENAESGRSLALTIATALMVAVVIVLGTGRALVFGDAFHEFAESRLERSAGLPEATAAVHTYQVRSYLRFGGTDIMDELAFSYRERLHFKEVRGLISDAEYLLFLASHAAAGLLVCLLAHATRCGRYALALLAESLTHLSFALTVVVAFGLLLALDFDTSFYMAHGFVFDSRHWLLPHDSLTVQLFPRQYFVDLFTAWGAILMMVAAVSAWTAKSLGRNVRTAANSARITYSAS